MDAWLADGFAATLAAADVERAADAMAAATAAYARVSLADRFRAGIGLEVSLSTFAGPPREPVGRVLQVAADAVVIGARSGPSWVIPFSAVSTARGLPAGHRPAHGAGDRLGIGHVLRSWCGQRVEVACRISRMTGVLQRVGADHLEVSEPAGVTLVGWAELAWARTTG